MWSLESVMSHSKRIVKSRYCLFCDKVTAHRIDTYKAREETYTSVVTILMCTLCSKQYRDESIDE